MLYHLYIGTGTVSRYGTLVPSKNYTSELCYTWPVLSIAFQTYEIKPAVLDQCFSYGKRQLVADVSGLPNPRDGIANKSHLPDGRHPQRKGKKH
jgi:hypothetical protein